MKILIWYIIEQFTCFLLSLSRMIFQYDLPDMKEAIGAVRSSKACDCKQTIKISLCVIDEFFLRK